MKNSLISLVLAVIITSLPASGEILHASVEYNAEMARKAAFENVVYQIPASKIQSHLFDKDIEESKKEIKLLELYLQHGREERVGYNPIDRLVGIYNDIIENELITIKEYARNTEQ